MLGSAIDDNVSNSIVAQLLFLEAENPEKDITLYINSPGGSITSGMAIYDTMQYIKPNVSTSMHRYGRFAWVLSYWPLAKKANVMHCQTVKS